MSENELLSNAGQKPLRSWLRIASHGAAVLLGVVVWQVLSSGKTLDGAEARGVEGQSSRADASGQASAWIDAKLANLREKEALQEQDSVEAATLEEFLEEERKESEKWWREWNEELDQVIVEAGEMDEIPDPVAAIRAALQDRSTYLDELVLFQYWLDSDPDSALAHLGESWKLLEREAVGALLGRRFGAGWMLARVADQETPFRLRKNLAHELGRQLAHGKGLALLLELYQAIPEPRLKLEMAFWFSDEWPRAKPQVVARFFAGEVPHELRDTLMASWGPNMGSSAWERTWLKQVCEAVGPEMVETYFGDSPDETEGLAGFGIDPEQFEARQAMSLDELISELTGEGKDRVDAIQEAMWSKMHQGLDGGPALVEQVGEGQLTRTEFLDEMRRQIPGASDYPDALERAGWSMLAWVEDPQAVADWAGDLHQRGDMGEFMIREFGQGSIYGDPRIPLRLSRYRIVTAGMENDRPRRLVLGHAAWEWTRWQAVSPGHAEAWRDELPSDAILLQAILEEEEMNRRRRGEP